MVFTDSLSYVPYYSELELLRLPAASCDIEHNHSERQVSAEIVTRPCKDGKSSNVDRDQVTVGADESESESTLTVGLRVYQVCLLPSWQRQ